jgi:carbon monoxide dehydrogenase subunit G
MKLIRLALISIVMLFVLASVMGMLLPANVLVSRAVNLNVPKDSIMPYIKDIEQWRAWIEGMQDPSVKIYSSTDADLGGTRVKITGISDTTVVSSWTGKGGNMQTSTLRLIAAPQQKLTIVQWQFEQKLKWYPWERFGSIMNDKILGTMMEKNLNNLKTLTEKN